LNQFLNFFPYKFFTFDHLDKDMQVVRVISELKQVTFLTARTLTGSKVDVFHQSQPLTQSSDVTHAVRVVKNVTCLSSLFSPIKDDKQILKPQEMWEKDET
jgi:hypothetical protein